MPTIVCFTWRKKSNSVCFFLLSQSDVMGLVEQKLEWWYFFRFRHFWFSFHSSFKMWIIEHFIPNRSERRWRQRIATNNGHMIIMTPSVYMIWLHSSISYADWYGTNQVNREKKGLSLREGRKKPQMSVPKPKKQQQLNIPHSMRAIKTIIIFCDYLHFGMERFRLFHSIHFHCREDFRQFPKGPAGWWWAGMGEEIQNASWHWI